MRYKISIAINVLLLLAIIVLGVGLYATPGQSSPKAVTQGQRRVSVTSSEAPKPPIDHIFGELDDFTYRAKVDSFAHRPIRIGGAVMLGDSLTDFGAWNEYFPSVRVVNRGISGDNTYGVLHRLDQVVLLKPRLVFLMIGVNDLFWGASVSDVAPRYRQIVEKLRARLPGSRIYVQSVFPFRRRPVGDYGYLDNKDVVALNQKIKEVAAEYGVTFVDVASRVTGGDGQLMDSLTVDGIHLNGAGYISWVAALKPYMR